MKYFYLIAGTLIILVIIGLSILLPPYLEKKQKQRDRSLGCFQYRQMLKESEESYALNPNGKKWVRESMAAEGLRKDFGCSDKNKRSNWHQKPKSIWSPISPWTENICMIKITKVAIKANINAVYKCKSSPINKKNNL